MSVQVFQVPFSVQPPVTSGAGSEVAHDLAADFAALARVILGAGPVAAVQVAPVEEPLATVLPLALPAAPAVRGAMLRELAFLDD